MKKKQRGFSIINIILLIFIIICLIILFLIFNNGSQIENVYENLFDKSSTYSNKLYVANTGENNSNTNQEKVMLSNSIYEMSNNYQDEAYNEGKRYYYNQLNSTGKSMYDTIINNIDKLIDGYAKIEFSINSSDAGDYFQEVWDAVSLDRPDLFWVETQKISLVTTTTSFLGKTKYKYSLEPKDGENYYVNYFNTSSDVKASKLTIEKITDDIIQRANGSTYDKIKIVHDELVNRIEYNQESNVNNSNIYGALIQNKCVCEGYAEAFKYILDRLDIPCVTVYGTGIDKDGSSEAHAWNYVKMDNDAWYAVDSTWDDPIIIGNGRITDKIRYRYFLKGSDNFNSTHIEDGDVSKTGQTFKYPILSRTDY